MAIRPGVRAAAEARELLALVQVAPQRIRLLEIDLKSNFRAIIALNVPVACWTGAEQDVAIASGALLALDYPREAISVPTPGYAFFSILQPRGVWHANVRPGRAVSLLGVNASGGNPRSFFDPDGLRGVVAPDDPD